MVSSTSKPGTGDKKKEVVEELKVDFPADFTKLITEDVASDLEKIVAMTDALKSFQKNISSAIDTTSLKGEAILSSYLSSFVFARERRFNNFQMVAFLGIINWLIIEIPKRDAVEVTLMRFKSFFLSIIKLTDNRLNDLFQTNDIFLMTDYIMLTFFQQFRLLHLVMNDNNNNTNSTANQPPVAA